MSANVWGIFTRACDTCTKRACPVCHHSTQLPSCVGWYFSHCSIERLRRRSTAPPMCTRSFHQNSGIALSTVRGLPALPDRINRVSMSECSAAPDDSNTRLQPNIYSTVLCALYTIDTKLIPVHHAYLITAYSVNIFQFES